MKFINAAAGTLIILLLETLFPPSVICQYRDRQGGWTNHPNEAFELTYDGLRLKIVTPHR